MKYLPGCVLKAFSSISNARLSLFVVSSIFSNLIGGGPARQKEKKERNISCHVSLRNEEMNELLHDDSDRV